MDGYGRTPGAQSGASVSLAERDWTLPTGAKAQSVTERYLALADLTILTSGRLSLVGIYLRAGQSLSTISFVSGATPLATGSNQWYSIYSAALAKLAVTADDTNTAWAANTVKTLAIAGAPYVVPASGRYYVGINIVASTVPTLRGVAGASTIAAIAPILSGFANTGLTNPASAPDPATLTGAGNFPLAYVS